MVLIVLKRHIPLWIILTVMLVKGLIWVYLIPPLQNPDEPSHFGYVQYLGEESRVPVQKHELSFSEELSLFAGAVRFNEIQFKPEQKYYVNHQYYDTLEQVKGNTEMRVSQGSNSATGYPPGYYFLASFAYKLVYDGTIFERFYATRIFSVLLSLIAVALAYFVGKKIESKSILLACALAIMTGMQPMFSMVSSAVNNDILMITVSIALILWLLCLIDSVTKKKLLAGGILVGLGLLIKPQMFFVSGTVLLIALIVFIKRYKLAFILKSAAYVVLPMLIVFLPWGIFSFVHYGSVFGGVAGQPYGDPSHGLGWYFQNAFFNEEGRERFFNTWVRMFWGYFGWLDTRFSSVWIYKLIACIMITSMIGAIYGIIRKKENYKVVALCMIFTFLNFAFLYLVEILYFSEYHRFMLQGRYLFTALVPINIILMYGIRYLLPPISKNYIYYSFALGMILFNLSSIDLILSRYYE